MKCLENEHSGDAPRGKKWELKKVAATARGASFSLLFLYYLEARSELQKLTAAIVIAPIQLQNSRRMRV